MPTYRLLHSLDCIVTLAPPPSTNVGKVKEMARLLRAKNDLQEVVVSSDYNQRKKNFTKKGRLKSKNQEMDDDDPDDADASDENIGDIVRNIILDESGFWKELVDILKATYPIVCLLRLLDGNKPCLSLVYSQMHRSIQSVEELTDKGVAWAAEAKTFVERRWEYLHSDFHAAAYALDPRYIEHVNDLDQYCMEGLFRVFRRMCIRDCILKAGLDVSDAKRVARLSTRPIRR